MIYDLSLKTLKCCYHEHYEDYPWREQSLYILDSANQMMCGFYCFSNPEAARSSFALIPRGKRKDGLLPICAPTSFDFLIPSFSLELFGAIEEYISKTHDLAFLRESYSRMEKVMNSFLAGLNNEHLENLIGPSYSNFYEWRTGLSGARNDHKSDLIGSFLFLLALESMGRLASLIGKEDSYSSLAASLRSYSTNSTLLLIEAFIRCTKERTDLIQNSAIR